MLLNILSIFCLFMANGLCKKDAEQYIENIRHDYCIDYCANKCRNANVSESDKKCTNSKKIVITDKYTIELFDKNVTISWKIYPVNLEYLNKLTNRSDYTVKKLEINIDVPRTKTNAAQVLNHIMIPSIRYMEVLDLKKLSEFQSESILVEKDIDVRSGPSAAHLQLETHLKMNVSALLNNYFSLRMEKLKEVYISNSSPEKCTLHSNVFDNATQLERIEFNNIDLANFSKATFNNLTKIKILKFIHCNLTSHEFLRSHTLQNNLEVIQYDSLAEIEYKFFENYKNLHKIDVSFGMPDSFSKVSTTNITAFVCINRICLFNLGTNGKGCPKNCICQLSPHSNSFAINCDNQGIAKVPDLPTPITGITNLHFENNALTELPRLPSHGYDIIRELHLANNKISNLGIEQLPQNLTLLDISNNNITSLDSKVVEFLQKRNITFVQSGVNWECHCENEKLERYLSTLQKRVEKVYYKNFLITQYNSKPYYTVVDNTVHHHHLNGPCPGNCSCCVNGSQFLVNCTNRGLTEIPPIPEVHRAILDISNNNITTLSYSLSNKISSFNLTLFISGNPWNCTCNEIHFQGLLYNIKDLSITKCSDSELLTNVMDQCSAATSSFVIIIMSLTLVAGLLVLLYCYWNLIWLWLWKNRLETIQSPRGGENDNYHPITDSEN